MTMFALACVRCWTPIAHEAPTDDEANRILDAYLDGTDDLCAACRAMPTAPAA